jgi:FkbM family methyltransferase
MAAAVARLRGLWRRSGASGGLRSLVRWLPAQAALPILWGPLRGKRWIVRSSFESCWLGVYEQEKQSAFSAAIRPGAVVYDVGANVGFYTLLAAKLTGPTGRVYSFEPLPRNLQFLNRHVALNGLNNVRVFAGAVADRPGVARFDDSGIPEMAHIAADGALEVATFQLDDLLEKGAIRPPNVIKIDVEGAEVEVLKGAQRLLAQNRPRLLLATHGPDVHRDSCALLQSMGYRVESLDSRPLEQSSEVRAVPINSSGDRPAHPPGHAARS